MGGVLMKIGFIGCGNMAQAIVSGLAKTKIAQDISISVYDRNPEKVNALAKRTGINIAGNLLDLIRESHFIFIAVKPNDVEDLFVEIDPELKEKVIVTMAAGLEIKTINDMISGNNGIVRIIPNTPIEICEGMTSISFNDRITKKEKRFIIDVFSNVGSVKIIDEDLSDVVGAISGSGPAYTYYFISCLMDAAEEHGMNADDARVFAAQVVIGSAKMVFDSDKDISVMIDDVCSPGGSTIEAMNIFWKSDYQKVIKKAITKAINKNTKLGKI